MSAPRLAKIWMNGQMVDAETSSISVTSSTVHGGWGVIEDFHATRTIDGTAVIMHRAHIERLFRSCRIVGLDVSWTQDELMAATKELLVKNKHVEANIRILVCTGSESMEIGIPGNVGRVIIFTYPSEPMFNVHAQKNGVKVKTSPWHIPGAQHFPLGAQLTGLQSVVNLARKEALEAGYDEALFVDEHGYVQQTACHEIFAVQDGELLISPWQELSGMSVTKSIIKELARNLDIPMRVQSFDASSLYVADEVFIASPQSGIMSVSSIDHRDVSPTGPVTRNVTELYNAIVKGHNQRFNHMIDRV